MEYEYDEKTNIVTAKMISDIELKNTKPSWKLSEDKKIYTKQFTGNIKYNTPAEDIYGNNINVEINVTDVRYAKIKMNYKYDDKTKRVYAQIISKERDNRHKQRRQNIRDEVKILIDKVVSDENK